MQVGSLLPLSLILAACASVPQTPPEWAARGVEAVYPQAAYIAQEGRGKTRQAAEADALGALSRFFLSEVSSTTHSSSSWSSGGGNSARVEVNNFVNSTAKLFAVRYAATWYNPRDKEYAALACVNREEAWAIFEPRLQREVNGFRALWLQAETETVPLKMLFAYQSAQQYANRSDFTGVMSFGEVLYPAKMTALVRDARAQTAQLAAKITEARNMASIFLDCPKDFESNLSGTLTKLLSGEKLIVAKTRNSASAVCEVTVDEGFQHREGTGDFYTPRLNLVLSDKKGTPLFSYSAAPGRQSAMTADVAKRRAYMALAAALENNFIEEFNKSFELKK